MSTPEITWVVFCLITPYSRKAQPRRCALCLMLLAIQRGEGNLSMTVYTQARLLLLSYTMILLTFRSNSFAVISDISKAFHHVIVHPEHRKWTKFLWVNPEREAQLIYQFNVLILVSRSSPFDLSQVLETHTSSRAKPICNLASYFYVDNLVKTYEDEGELISEKVAIDSVLEEANMPLRGWISNSKKFNDTYQVNEPSLQMVLGISWNVISDCIAMVVSKRFPVELSS